MLLYTKLKNSFIIAIREIISFLFYAFLFYIASIPCGFDGWVYSFVTLVLWCVLILVSHIIIQCLIGKKLYNSLVRSILIDTYFGCIPFTISCEIATCIVNHINYDGRNDFLYNNTLMCLHVIDDYLHISSNNELWQYFYEGSWWDNYAGTRYQLTEYIHSCNCSRNDYKAPLFTAYITSIDFILYLYRGSSSDPISSDHYNALKYLYGKIFFGGATYIEAHKEVISQPVFQEEIYDKLFFRYKQLDGLKRTF